MDNATVMRVVFFIPLFVIVVVPFWRIFSRAGFAGALSLLMVVPLVNLIVLYYVAFARWNVKPETSFPPAQS